MKIKLLPIILPILIIALISCEQEFNVDMEKQHVVLHSLAFEGECPKIILAQTLDIFPEYPFNLKYFDQPYYEENVEIIVSSGNEVYTNFEIHQAPLNAPEWDNETLSPEIMYFTDENFIPEAGKEYTIEVYELETYPEVKRSGFSLKSSTKIPSKVPVTIEQLPDKLNSTYTYMDPNDTVYNQVYNISFPDSNDAEDYYYITLTLVRSSYEFSMDTVNMDDLWNNSINYQQSMNCWLQNLKFYSNQITGLGELNQNNYGSELQGYLINDFDFNGEIKTINVELDGWSFTLDDANYFVVEVFHISKEYYNYYKTLQTQSNTQEDIFTEPTQIYTNIDGGLGVFAGATLTTQYIKVEPMPN